MSVTLLGPQRTPTVDRVARTLDPDGPIATITAGWRDREPDDAELDALLGSRTANLALYRRWLHVHQDDPEFGAAQLQLREVLDETQSMYLVRVEHALRAVDALHRREQSSRRDDEIADAIGAVRALDERHVAQVSDLYAGFDDTWRPHERPVVAGHRQQVADIVRAATALVVTGGHVGVLSSVLRLFDVTGALQCPVIAWSAGAMALTDRIVLFHDRTPQGRTPAEILAPGTRLVTGIVLLPHARSRLLIDDVDRMAVFARRFAPARCVLLEQDTRFTLNGIDALPDGVRVLGEDGRIQTVAAQ
ncbi:MAG TPA: hypothetical protein VH395_03420 [Jatrophihabitantaceae bacterium]|jgi:hypothetical protein